MPFWKKSSTVEGDEAAAHPSTVLKTPKTPRRALDMIRLAPKCCSMTRDEAAHVYITKSRQADRYCIVSEQRSQQIKQCPVLHVLLPGTEFDPSRIWSLGLLPEIEPDTRIQLHYMD